MVEPSRGLASRIRSTVRYLVNSQTFWFTLSILISKAVLHHKLGDTGQYRQISDHFFPEWIRVSHTFWLDVPIVACILSGARPLLAIAAGLSILQILHPQSFGIQNYVVTFWLLCWYSTRDRKHSLQLGRAVASFIFILAAIGKLTPGWLGGAYPDHLLPQLSSRLPFHSYLFVIGELTVGFSFLLAPKVGAAIDMVILAGMLGNVGFLIFDAIGPIVGLMLMVVCVTESERGEVRVFLDPDCGICRKIARWLSYLAPPKVIARRLPDLEFHQSIDPKRALLHIAAIDENNRAYYGYETYCEIVARLPLVAFLAPLMRLKVVAYSGNWLYLKVAERRTCAT